MSRLSVKVKLAGKKLLNFIPTQIPVGLTAFQAWSDDIISTYGFPDNDSIRFSLAVMVLHLDSTASTKPKRYFAKAISKAMSNEVVSQVIQDLKAKQQAKVKSEATSTGASDEPKTESLH